jgi:uncharacterized iron-regulated membrane protein
VTLHARSLLRRIHLWLGLALGLPFAVLAVTGSALVFYIELDAWLHPGIRVETSASAPDWTSPVWDQALATAHTQWPGAAGKWSFEVTGKAGAIPARYYAPTEGHAAGHGSADPLMVWFTPDGRQVLRQARWGDYLMTFFYDIHRNFLAGDVGNIVVGWTGVATLFLLATGLLTWWPRGSWRKALAYKRTASPTRRLYDLHKLVGLPSLALLLILSATGALLALPAEKTWLLSKLVAPVVAAPAPVSTVGAGRQVSIGQALATAHRALPDGRIAWIDVPGPGDGVFRFRIQVSGDPTHRFPYSFVFVDQYSGAVLAVHDARQGTASTTVNTWIRPLHDGSVAGLSTRVLAVIAGLTPPTLFITGLLRWLRRRPAKRRPA